MGAERTGAPDRNSRIHHRCSFLESSYERKLSPGSDWEYKRGKPPGSVSPSPERFLSRTHFGVVSVGEKAIYEGVAQTDMVMGAGTEMFISVTLFYVV